MGLVKPVDKVKLFVGMLASDISEFEKVRPYLENSFGKIDSASDLIPFSYTDFYDEELGVGIFRKFYSFDSLIDALELSEVKLCTNDLELLFSDECGRRRINLDPGYMALSKIALASVKERPHRIHIGKGIFAETTLYYRRKTFRPWEWTYSDYASAEYISYFNYLRSLYADQLNMLNKNEPR